MEQHPKTAYLGWPAGNACHWCHPLPRAGGTPASTATTTTTTNERLHFLLGHSWWLATSLVLDLPLSFALPHTPGAESPCESRHSYILTDFYISFLNSSIWCTGGWRNIEGVHNPALPNEANNILEIDE